MAGEVPSAAAAGSAAAGQGSHGRRDAGCCLPLGPPAVTRSRGGQSSSRGTGSSRPPAPVRPAQYVQAGRQGPGPHKNKPTSLGSMGILRVGGSCSSPSAYLLTRRSSCHAATLSCEAAGAQRAQRGCSVRPRMRRRRRAAHQLLLPEAGRALERRGGRSKQASQAAPQARTPLRGQRGERGGLARACLVAGAVVLLHRSDAPQHQLWQVGAGQRHAHALWHHHQRLRGEGEGEGGFDAAQAAGWAPPGLAQPLAAAAPALVHAPGRRSQNAFLMAAPPPDPAPLPTSSTSTR